MGGSATAVAGIIFFASPNAVAEPMPPPVPSPVTVTQTVTVAPGAGSPLALPQAAICLTRCRSAGRSRCRPRARARRDSAPPRRLVPQAGASRRAEPWRRPSRPPSCRPRRARSPTTSRARTSRWNRNAPRASRRSTSLCRCPPGWTQVPDPNVPDAFAVIANRDQPRPLHPNAQVVSTNSSATSTQGGDHPRVRRQPVAVRLAEHRRVAGRLQRLPVVDHRGHLPAERHDAEHVTAPCDRDVRSRQVSRVVVGDVEATTQGATAAADATDAIVNGFQGRTRDAARRTCAPADRRC